MKNAKIKINIILCNRYNATEVKNLKSFNDCVIV